MDYSYQPMDAEDYQESRQLWASIPGIAISGADSRERIAAYLGRNPGQSFVCKFRGKLIGTILCGNDGRRAYIHHTAVTPGHRNRGVAAELVRLALETQKKLGMEKCHLFVLNDNDPGKTFWNRMGFSLRRDIGIMSKDL